MRTLRSELAAVVLAATALAAGGCEFVLGLDDPQLYLVTGTTGSGGTTSSGGGGSVSSGGGQICAPGMQIACPYFGPAGTEGIGNCKSGAKTCNDDGSGYSPCAGEVVPQPEDPTVIGDEGCDGYKPGEAIWSQGFGGIGNQLVTAISVDADDNTIVAGDFEGSIDFGGGKLSEVGGGDVFLAKLDAFGKFIWARSFGDVSSQTATDLAIDKGGNILLAGNFAGKINFGCGEMSSAGGQDIYLVRLGPTGECIASQRFGGTGDEFNTAVAISPTGVVYLTGRFSGMIDFGNGGMTSAGSTDAFLVKLDSSLMTLSAARYGDAAAQTATAIASTSGGDAVFTGAFKGAMTVDEQALTSAGGQDVFLARHNVSGADNWSASFGDVLDFQVGASVGVDPLDDIFLTGSFYGSLSFGLDKLTSAGGQDVFLAKLDPAGVPLWSQRFGDSGFEVPTALAADTKGNVFVAGHFNSTINFGGEDMQSAGGEDIFLAKLDSSGGHLWSQRFGDIGDGQEPQDIAVDSQGNVVMCGYLLSTIDFGNGPLTSLASQDVFIAKFAK